MADEEKINGQENADKKVKYSVLDGKKFGGGPHGLGMMMIDSDGVLVDQDL